MPKNGTSAPPARKLSFTPSATAEKHISKVGRTRFLGSARLLLRVAVQFEFLNSVPLVAGPGIW